MVLIAAGSAQAFCVLGRLTSIPIGTDRSMPCVRRTGMSNPQKADSPTVAANREATIVPN
jgi:hypothetical protein